MTRKFYCDFCGEEKAVRGINLTAGMEDICESCIVLLENYRDRGDFKHSINRADFGVKDD